MTSRFSQPDPVTGFFFRRISYFDFLFLSMKSRALMVFVGTGFWLPVMAELDSALHENITVSS
jgi:hypothetical protein